MQVTVVSTRTSYKGSNYFLKSEAVGDFVTLRIYGAFTDCVRWGFVGMMMEVCGDLMRTPQKFCV